MSIITLIRARAGVETPPPPPPGLFQVSTVTLSGTAPAADGVGLVNWNSKLRMLGGWYNNNTTVRDVWEIDADGSMVKLADFPAPGRHTFGHGTIKGVSGAEDCIFIWGADPQSSVSYVVDKSVLRYRESDGWVNLGQMDLTGNWTLYQHCIHYVSGVPYLYIAGGQTGIQPQWGDVPNLGVYRCPVTNGNVPIVSGKVQMEKVGDLPEWRSNGYMVSHNGNLIIAGGGTYLGFNDGGTWKHSYLNTIIQSTDHGATWSVIKTDDIFAAQYPNLYVDSENKIWFLQGSNINVRPSANGNGHGLYYSADGINWTRVSNDTSMSKSHAKSMAQLGDYVYIVYGNGDAGVCNEIYKVRVR